MAAKRARGETQQKILDYINAEIESRGYPPSVREIGDAVGLKSTSTVHGHLCRLEKRGMIHRDAMKPRAMGVTIAEQKVIPVAETRRVPVLGRVAAGYPILAEEYAEDFISLPQRMLGEGTCFALAVRGESMIMAGIMDGDYVVVRRQQDAQNGEIVVAMIDGSATVKRFFRESGRFRLQPENPSMEPIYTPTVEILGKVISLYRIVR